MTQGAYNLAAAARLWAVWRAQGLRDVVVAPGSRSAPLTVAAARAAGLTTHVVIDERSAAFFALGLAKAGRRPVALVCTSGTAAANFLPAACEASLAHVPLLLVTADRPPELHDSGAAQTMRQHGLYGTAVRADFVLPAPDGAVSIDGFALRAWAAATDEQGPVHVNFPFREPLLPAPDEDAAPAPPLPRLLPSRRVLDGEAAQAVANLLGAAQRPLVVLGPDAVAPEERARLGEWLRSRRIAALADIGSGARFGAASEVVVGAFEAVLRTAPPAHPDVVIHFGLQPTSKTLQAWLAAADARHVFVGPRHAWADPLRLATHVVTTTPAAFFEGVPPTQHDGAYAQAWRECAAALEHRTALLLAGEAGDRLPESRFAAAVGDLVPEGGVLFVSNSMPVREADAFARPAPKDVRVYVNRGVNGIDGIVSTALGCAAAEGRSLLAVIGDVAFQHDLGGLALARQAGVTGAIVVVNNQGGAIFEHLPARGHEDVFEPYFAAPQALDFAAATKAFGLGYTRADTPEAAAAALQVLVREPLSIVELRVVRDAKGAARDRFWQTLRQGALA